MFVSCRSYSKENHDFLKLLSSVNLDTVKYATDLEVTLAKNETDKGVTHRCIALEFVDGNQRIVRSTANLRRALRLDQYAGQDDKK